MGKTTQLVIDQNRTNWEIYQDLMEVAVTMTTNQLLTMAKMAMNQTVAQVCSDELARRRPQGR